MANMTRFNLTTATPIEDMFDELTRGFFVRPLSLRQADLQIKLDVKEDDKAYKILADIPGVKKEDIHVDVEGNHISLSAETRTEREEAEYKDGVLNLTLPKKNGGATRRISVS